jgi:hypothetical protein
LVASYEQLRRDVRSVRQGWLRYFKDVTEQ